MRMRQAQVKSDLIYHGVDLRANLKSISHRCHFFDVAFVWELTKETIHLPVGCLQSGDHMNAAGAGEIGPHMPAARHLSVHKLVLQKSIPTPIRRLILYIRRSKGYVDGFVRE